MACGTWVLNLGWARTRTLELTMCVGLFEEQIVGEPETGVPIGLLLALTYTV